MTPEGKKDTEGKKEKKEEKNRWLDGDQEQSGHVTGGVPWNFLPALSPSLSQQLVSLLAPSA